MIELNNKRKMKLEVNDDSLTITIYNDKEEVEERRTINGDELVLLYDYYVMKKDNNEPIL